VQIFSLKLIFMESNDLNLATDRRSVIGTLATGAAAMSLAGLAAPLQSMAKGKKHFHSNDDPDAWFNKIKGKHRIVFDTPEPRGMMPFAWPRVFLITNGMTGTPEKDNSVVVILRHEAIPYAMNSSLWAKYKFGEVFKINDDKTKASSVRNAFWKPEAGDFQVPGVGPVAIGINELQDSGVMFCVCNMALTVYSSVIAQMTNAKQEDVYKEFTEGLLPGIQVVPSGVWAVGRAQEHGCAYCHV
jgi:intracellular sulfur oxidation DsrE/DsrF family protein